MSRRWGSSHLTSFSTAIPPASTCADHVSRQIPDDGDAAADDPRDFDPDDGPDPNLPFFLGAPAGGAPGVLRFQLPGGVGGGAFVATGGAGGGAQALGGLNPLTLAMLRSFGMPAPGDQGAAPAGGAGEGSQDGQEQQQAGEGGGAEAPNRAHQVPIRNLATCVSSAVLLASSGHVR